MTYSTIPISEFLANTSPFAQLSPATREQLSSKLQPLRYRMGQAIVERETIPAHIAILYEGQARLLGYPPKAIAPVTLQLLKPGEVIGWASLLRGVACETAIASTETICLTLSAADFLALLQQEPVLADAFHNRCSPIEAFDLLSAELDRRANGAIDLKEITILASEAVMLNLPPGKTALRQLDPNLVWFLSGGTTNFTLGDRLPTEDERGYIEVVPSQARLVGFPMYEAGSMKHGTAQTSASVLQPLAFF